MYIDHMHLGKFIYKNRPALLYNRGCYTGGPSYNIRRPEAANRASVLCFLVREPCGPGTD